MSMNVSSSSSTTQLLNIFRTLGHAVDDKSRAGTRVSADEAQKVIGEIGKLSVAEQTQLKGAFQKLLTSDFISVTDGARATFAKFLGVDAKELTPRQEAQLKGLSQAKSAFHASLQSLSRIAQVDKKTIEQVVTNAQQFLSPPAQQFVAASLLSASKEGLIKVDQGDANRALTKWVAKLDQDGGVTKQVEQFKKPADRKVDFLASCIAKGMNFEDIVAAFFLHVVGQIKEDVQDRIAQVNGEPSPKAAQNASPNVGQNGQNGQGLLGSVGVATQTPGLPAANDGSFSSLTEGLTGTSTQKPVQNLPQNPVANASVGTAGVDKTRQNLEAVVQSLHAHVSDDGIIDTKEANQIAEKFRRLDGPVATLVASALANGLRRTDLDLGDKGGLGPVLGWIREKLGAGVDLSHLSTNATHEPSSEVAKKLLASDSLEHKITGFLIDAFTASNTTLKARMETFKQFRDDLCRYPAAAAAAAQLVPSSAAQVSQTAQTAQTSQTAQTPVSSLASGSLTSGLSGYGNAANDSLLGGLQDQSITTGTGVAQNAQATTQVYATPAQAAINTPLGTTPAKSREELIEEIHQLTQQISELMQLFSNIMNTMHMVIENSIRGIR